MRIYVTHRHSPIGRAGQWLIADEEGEPLFPIQLLRIDQKLHFRRTSKIGIPFSTLADYMVEPGAVQRRRRDGTFGSLSAAEAQRAIDTFQHDMEDVFEEILEERLREADPSLLGPSGIFLGRDRKE